MADRTPGRIIRQSISEDRAFHSLSLEAQLFYLMLRPHFNAWGKLKADPNLLKGTVVPLNGNFSSHTISRCLNEISHNTPVKLFQVEGIPYLQDLDWDNHQRIRKDRAKDLLPSYPSPKEEISRDVSSTAALRIGAELRPNSARPATERGREAACRGP